MSYFLNNPGLQLHKVKAEPIVVLLFHTTFTILELIILT